MKSKNKAFVMLLVVVLSISLFAVPAYAQSIDGSNYSIKSYALGGGSTAYSVQYGFYLHIYDGIYEGTYFVPEGTLLYYGNPGNIAEYVVIAGKAYEYLDAKYDNANCGVGNPVGTFTMRHDTATRNFQQFAINEGSTNISVDGQIGNRTWTAMCYYLG